MANWSNGFFWIEPATARLRPLGLAVAAALAAGWLITAKALPASAQTACGAAPPLEGSIQNSVVEGDVIVLGSLSDRPYVVAIPGEAEADLEALRRCVADAFVTTARLGPFCRPAPSLATLTPGQLLNGSDRRVLMLGSSIGHNSGYERSSCSQDNPS